MKRPLQSTSLLHPYRHGRGLSGLSLSKPFFPSSPRWAARKNNCPADSCGSGTSGGEVTKAAAEAHLAAKMEAAAWRHSVLTTATLNSSSTDKLLNTQSQQSLSRVGLLATTPASWVPRSPDPSGPATVPRSSPLAPSSRPARTPGHAPYAWFLSTTSMLEGL